MSRGLCRAHSFKTLSGRSLSLWRLDRKDPLMMKRPHRGRGEITDVCRLLGRRASGNRLEFADGRLALRKEEGRVWMGTIWALGLGIRIVTVYREGTGSICHTISFSWHLRTGSCTEWNTKSHSVVIYIGLCNSILILPLPSYMLLHLHQCVNNPGWWTWHCLVVDLKLSLFCLLLYSKPSLITIGILSWD